MNVAPDDDENQQQQRQRHKRQIVIPVAFVFISTVERRARAVNVFIAFWFLVSRFRWLNCPKLVLAPQQDVCACVSGLENIVYIIIK